MLLILFQCQHGPALSAREFPLWVCNFCRTVLFGEDTWIMASFFFLAFYLCGQLRFMLTIKKDLIINQLPWSNRQLGSSCSEASLTWNDHIEELVKKASRKRYFLLQLKRAQVPSDDLVAYHCACIRSSLDYASTVYHHTLPKYSPVSASWALSCIFPGVSYNDARLHKSPSWTNNQSAF